MQIYTHNVVAGLNARFYRLATSWWWYDEADPGPYDDSHVSATAVAAGIAFCPDDVEAPLLVDIEAFNLDGTQEEHDFAVTQLALACSMWKAAFPKKPIGIYRLVPERNYDPASLAYYSYSDPGGAHAAADLILINTWKTLTDRSIAALHDYVDFICPSVYVLYADDVQNYLYWQYYASANIAEAVRIARKYNKQVWPIICDADSGADGDSISDAHWETVVKTVAACAGVDGIMIYIYNYADHPSNYVSVLNAAAAVHHKSWPYTLTTYHPAVITAGGLYLSISRDPDTPITASAPTLLFQGTAGLDVAQGAVVASWTSQDTLSYAAVQATSESRPTFDAAAMSSGGGVVFDGVNDYLRIATCPLTSTTAGTVVICFRTGATAWLTMGDQVLVSAANEAAANEWLEIGIDIAGYPYLQVNKAGSKHTVRCSTQLSNEMDYCLAILWNDTAYKFVLNDVVQEQVVRVAGTLQWFGDVAGVDGFVIGGTLTSAGIQRCFEGKIATVAGYNTWSTIVQEAEA